MRLSLIPLVLVLKGNYSCLACVAQSTLILLVIMVLERNKVLISLRCLCSGGVVSEFGVMYGEERSVISSILQRVD